MRPGNTVYDCFQGAISQYPDKPFLHMPAETAAKYELSETDYTYQQANDLVSQLIGFYSDVRVSCGRRVGLALDNRPQFFFHFLAINALGGSILPLNCAMQKDELRYQIDHSECELIIAASCHQARLQSITDIQVIEPKRLADALSLPERQEVPGDTPLRREAAILYTSGTTGRPKGCILSNEYFLAIGDLYTGLGGYCTFSPGEERIITPLPVTHMNALACSFMAAVQTGGCLIQLDRFHPRSWWESVRSSRATIMHYLGVMPAMLLNTPESAEDNFEDQIKFAFGAGCDPRHHARFEQRFGVKLIEAWAMTETGAGAWITASSEPRHVGSRCFGRAPEGLEYILVDEEGCEVAKGEPGELLVRRKGDEPRRHFFSEYFKDEAATEEAWRGGWFHTGDVVRVDEVGSFYFVDRRKNVIRRSGENIAAIDVESVLLRHESVEACVVLPVPDEIRGDEVCALVIAKDGAAQREAAESLFEFASEHLVYFKTPGYICFVDEIPMTASEKIKRGETKALAVDMVERGDCYDFRTLKKPQKAAQ